MVTGPFTAAVPSWMWVAVTLVPGAALHDEADRLTHAHATLSIHNHAPLPSPEPTRASGVDEAALGGYVVHALSDGFAGQAIGLPLVVLAMWGFRKQTPRTRLLVPTPREG